MSSGRYRHLSRWSTLFVSVVFMLVGCGQTGSGGATAVTSPLPSSPWITRVRAAGVVNVGYAAGLPWLGLDPVTDKWFGPSDDIAIAMASQLGVKLSRVNSGFQLQIPAIQAGRLDVSVVPFYATPTRLKVVDMSPWTSGGECYVALKTNSKINSLADFNSANVKMGNFVGSGQLALTQAKYPLAVQVTREATPGELGMFAEVASGKVDVADFDQSLMVTVQQKFPDFKILPSDCFTNPDVSTLIAIAYPKGDPGLQQFMTQLLAGLQPQLQADLLKYADPKFLGGS